VQVVPAATTREAWEEIDNYFASQSRACVISTRMALSTVQKGNSTVAEYFAKMKTLADEMASTGKPLEDEELVSYILAGVDLESLENNFIRFLVSDCDPFIIKCA
jgi:hypothetical protein